MITETLVFVLIFVAAKYFLRNLESVSRFPRKWKRTFELASEFPTSKMRITFSNVWEYLNCDTHIIYKRFIEQISDEALTKAWFGPKLAILIDSPADAKIVFNSKDCIDKPLYQKEAARLTQGTVFGHVEPWRSHRKILNPFFGNKALINTVVPIFNAKVKIFMEKIRSKEGMGEFNVFHELAALTLEIVLSAMELDVDIQSLDNKKRSAYVKNLEKYFELVTIRCFRVWLHINVIFRFSSIRREQKEAMSQSAMAFSPNILANSRAKLDDSNNNKINSNNNNENNNSIENAKIDDEKPHTKHKTFIRALVDPKNGFNDAEIEDEISTLLIAAQDTSANAASSTLLLLAMHKEVQAKVVAELHEVLGNSQNFIELDVEQLNRLTYLEMVINEAMRLMPVIPFILRTNDNEVALSEGQRIPIGSTIFIPIVKILKNKKFWGEDAEEFKPERFGKESFEKIHPYAFIPFAKGPRMCIGWRYAMFLIKIKLANFLLRYEVDTSLKLSELEFGVNITMTVCQGHMISIKKRSESA